MEDNLRAIGDLKKNARISQDRGELERAKDCYKNLLKAMEKVFPLYHYEFGEVYLNLARCLQMTAQGVEALKYFLEYEKLFEGMSFGQKQLALVRYEIGLRYIKEKIFEKALDYLQKSRKYLETYSNANKSISQNLHLKLAECYMQTNNHKEAIFYFEKTLTILNPKENINFYEESNFHINLSTCYLSQGQYNNALSSLKTAKNIYKMDNGKNTEALSLIFELLGKTHNKLWNTNKSMKYIDKYQKIKGTLSISKNPDSWVLYMNKGNNLCKQGKYAEALVNYDKCSQFLKENQRGDDLGIGELYINLGILYKNIGKFDEAYEYLNKCKTIREIKEPDSVHLAEIYYQLGNYYNENFYYEQSLEYYENYRNLIIKHLPKNYTKIAEATYLVINSLMLIENYNNALNMLKSIDWDEICKGNIHILANVYNKFSTCLIVDNKIPRALQYCKKSKDMMDKAFIKDTINYADCLYNFAWCYEMSGDIRKSFKCYRKCKKVLNKNYLAKDLRYAKLYMKLGVMNFYYENFYDAFEYLRDSLKMHLFLLKPNDKAFVPLFYHLGSVYFALQNYNESIFYYRKCKDLQIFTDSNDKNYYSKTLLCLGGAYLLAGLIKKAHCAFKESEEIQESSEQKDFIRISNIKNNKAICLAYNNDTEQALKLFKEGKTTTKNCVSKTNPILIRFYINISVCYFCIGNFYETLTNLKKVEILIKKALENKHPDLKKLFQPNDHPVISFKLREKLILLVNSLSNFIEKMEKIVKKTGANYFNMKKESFFARAKYKIEKYIIYQVGVGKTRNSRFYKNLQKKNPKKFAITNN